MKFRFLLFISIVYSSILFAQSTISVSTTKIDFGVVKLGTDKSELLTVANTGSVNVTVTMDGCTKYTSYFDVSDNQEQTTLAPGESKTYTVVAHGIAAGMQASQKLFIKNETSEEETEVNLSSIGDDDEPLIDRNTLTMAVGEKAVINVKTTYVSAEADNYEIVDFFGSGAGTSGGPMDRHSPKTSGSSMHATFTALKAGVVHVTFKDQYSSQTAVLTITVTDKQQDLGPGMVVWHKDGSKVVFSLSETPKITYTGEKVVIKAASTIEYDFQSIKKITYNLDELTRIKETNITKKIPFTSNGECITFLPSECDLQVKVVNLNGKVIKSFVVPKDDTASFFLNAFPASVYLIVVNGVTYKINVR